METHFQRTDEKCAACIWVKAHANIKIFITAVVKLSRLDYFSNMEYFYKYGLRIKTTIKEKSQGLSNTVVDSRGP